MGHFHITELTSFCDAYGYSRMPATWGFEGNRRREHLFQEDSCEQKGKNKVILEKVH